MRTIYYLIQKEFLQIFRDKAMLVIIFAIPVIQLVVLTHAATFELKKTPYHLVDFDQSAASQRLVSEFEATGYFNKVGQSFSTDRGIEDMLSNDANMVMVIPRDFGKNLHSGQPADIQFLINAVDGSTAGLMQSYSQSIVQQFSRQMQPDFRGVSASGAPVPIRITTMNRFNPTLDYIMYMVPGIISILVTLICLLLSILNIVREREIGTIEQLNVTPIKKYQFIVGKLVPTWLLSMLILTIALGVAYFFFEIPFRGNILLLYLTAGIYLLAIQGLGLLISNISETQQQAMFVNFFFVMIFMLMGGIFTPIESMPEWAQQLTAINPIAYFAKIMRMVLLKGSGWGDIQGMIGVLTFMAVILLPAAVWRYRKRTA